MTTGRELEASISTLLGMDNRRPDFRLRERTGVFVRSAVNAVITDSGTAKRRGGYQRKLSGSDCHSFWVDRATDTGYYADGATLYEVVSAGDGLERFAIATDLVPGAPLTFDRVGRDIVFSDGQTNRCIRDRAVVPFGVPDPQRMPAVTVGQGALSAGTYLVALAFANDDLEFSGTWPVGQFELPDNSSLILSNLPATWPAGATSLVAFVTAPNSNTPLAEVRLAAPAASTTISVLRGDGMETTTYLKSALPPGQLLRFFGGRLYVAAKDVLWYSDIYSPALCARSRNFVQFPAPITVLEPCDNGLYVVADQTYWIGGDIERAELKPVLPCGAAAGSAVQAPHAKLVLWMSDRGLCQAGPSGAVQLLTDKNVAIPKAAAGASLVLEADGQRHAVSTLIGAESTSAAARSYMTAEVIRKGTTL